MIATSATTLLMRQAANVSARSGSGRGEHVIAEAASRLGDQLVR
jgi:hypothetical protein